MRKYWAFCRASIQNTLTYRGPIFVWVLGNVLSLIAIVAVWLSTSGKNTIGGYSKPELVTYYFFALFLQWLNGWFPFYWLQGEIKHGEIILTTLAKPVSLFKRAFAEEAGWHLISIWVGIVVSLLLMLFLHQNIILDLLTFELIILFLAIGLSILVTFTTSLCMGMLAFWFTEIGALDGIFWTARMILGGQALPISFIPGFFQVAVKILPFRYMFSFPLEIYFGKLTPKETVFGFLAAICWFLVLVGLYRLMWNRGRRAYTAFGQ